MENGGDDGKGEIMNTMETLRALVADLYGAGRETEIAGWGLEYPGYYAFHTADTTYGVGDANGELGWDAQTDGSGVGCGDFASAQAALDFMRAKTTIAVVSM